MDTPDPSLIAPVHLDPLALGSLATIPWGFSPLWFVLPAIGIPGLVWLAMAWKRALDEDPHRLRRRGHRELQRLLKQADKQGRVPAAAQLHGWMRAAARTWGVAVASPTPMQIDDALRRHTTDTDQRHHWAGLWQNSERSLFAADGESSRQWLEQAASAAQKVSIPPRERWLPNRRRHWLPALLLGMLCTLLALPEPLTAQATLGADIVLPEGGDLAGARSQATDAMARNWNDWAAHFNLAAADIQDQKWNAAVAHGTIAFVQNPALGVGQDNLRFALTQVQSPDPTLRRLLSGYWYERFATWLSPAAWQRVGLLASLLFAGAVAVMVMRLYGPQHRSVVLASRAMAAGGAALLAVSILGWRSYGTLADPRAAILVQQTEIVPEPSDLTPREESSPAAAGSIVLTRRGFLTWQQVQVRADLTGWVRRDAVLPLHGTTAGAGRLP